MRHRGGMSFFKAGLLALTVIMVAVFLGFTKDIPFTKKHEIKAVFPSATSIRLNSPVRIAGVNVGKVAKVEPQPGSDAAVITMKMDEQALPIHADATAKIRPRIFLEGNFFVDLRPGSPSAPILEDGDTIKVTQTSTPVQLDQVLTALQTDTREDLKDTLDVFGRALNERPKGGGQTGAEAINDAYEDIAQSERTTAIVNEALLGVEPEKDIQRLLRGLADATGGLVRNEVQLKELISNFNRTMGAFAAEQVALRQGIRELGPTLENANGAFAALNDAFPPTRAFAREILPGVRETPATIEAGFPWIEQTRRLVSQRELRGLAQDLSPATKDLAEFVDTSIALFPRADRLAKCARDVVLPTGDIVIKDEFPSGEPNYREFMYALVGLSGEGQNFDGNGQYVRFAPGGGGQTVSLGEAGTAGGPFYTNVFQGSGARPKKPSRKPPYNDETQCHTSAIPDLNGPWAARSDFGQPVNP